MVGKGYLPRKGKGLYNEFVILSPNLYIMPRSHTCHLPRQNYAGVCGWCQGIALPVEYICANCDWEGYTTPYTTYRLPLNEACPW
jgi:hypothetical protein